MSKKQVDNEKIIEWIEYEKKQILFFNFKKIESKNIRPSFDFLIDLLSEKGGKEVLMVCDATNVKVTKEIQTVAKANVFKGIDRTRAIAVITGNETMAQRLLIKTFLIKTKANIVSFSSKEDALNWIIKQ